MDPTTSQTLTGSRSESTNTLDQPLNITLGVEFEFLILKSFTKDEDRPKSDNDKTSYGLSLVADALKQKPLTSASTGQQFTLPLAVQTQESSDSDHTKWNVVSDDTMKLKPREDATLKENNCDAFGVEVTSRKLFANSSEQTQQTIPYEDEISAVLSALQQGFNTPTAQDRRLVVNDTCGFHVHVGNDNTGFPLQTVENVLSLYTAFERVIDSLHAHTRIGGSGLAFYDLDEFESQTGSDPNDLVNMCAINNLHNVPLSDHFIGSAYATRRNAALTPQHAERRSTYPANAANPTLAQAMSGFHTADFIQILQSAPSIQALQEFFGKHRADSVKRATTINILNLQTSPNEAGKTNTLEFRQHAAVTSPEDTLPWVDFVQALVQYAHGQSAADVEATCTRAAGDSNLALADLLELLPIKASTRTHYLSSAKTTATATATPAPQQRSRSDSAAATVAPGPLQTITQALAKQRKQDHDRELVEQAVKNKFKAGGYGQFSSEFVEAYAPELNDEIKKQLTIGWEAPVYFLCPDFEDDDQNNDGEMS